MGSVLAQNFWGHSKLVTGLGDGVPEGGDKGGKGVFQGGYNIA